MSDKEDNMFKIVCVVSFAAVCIVATIFMERPQLEMKVDHNSSKEIPKIRVTDIRRYTDENGVAHERIIERLLERIDEIVDLQNSNPSTL